MKAHLFQLIACLSLCAADLGVISPRHGILLDHQTTRTDFQKFEVELKHRDTTNVVTLTLTNSLISHSDLVQLPSGRTTMGLKSYFWDGSVSDMAIYTFDLRRAAPPAPSAERAILRAGSEPPKSLINELARLQKLNALPPPPVPFRVLEEVVVDSSAALVPFRSHTLTNEQPWAPILPSTNGLDMETGLPMTEINIRLIHTNEVSETTNINVQGVLRVVRPLPNVAAELIVTNELRALPQATNRTYGEHLDWIEDRKGKRRNE